MNSELAMAADAACHNAIGNFIKHHSPTKKGKYRLICEFEFDPDKNWPILYYPAIEVFPKIKEEEENRNYLGIKLFPEINEEESNESD